MQSCELTFDETFPNDTLGGAGNNDTKNTPSSSSSFIKCRSNTSNSSANNRTDTVTELNGDGDYSYVNDGWRNDYDDDSDEDVEAARDYHDSQAQKGEYRNIPCSSLVFGCIFFIEREMFEY